MKRLAWTAIAIALLQAGCHSPATPNAADRAGQAKSVGAAPDPKRPVGTRADKKPRRSKAERDARRAAAGLVHRRAAYDTATWDAPPPEVRAILDVLVAATRSSADSGGAPAVVLDEGLSRVAAKLAADPAMATAIDPLLYQRTQEAGSPLQLRWVVRVGADQATLAWARQTATALQGAGTLVIGVGIDPQRPDDRVVVLTRKQFDLVGKVPRRRGDDVRVVLDASLRSSTPRLLLVSGTGIERVEGTRSGDTWSFHRGSTFDGTFASMMEYRKPADAFTDPYRSVSRYQLGVMHFGAPPKLPGDDAASLGEAIADLRGAWHRAPLRVDDAYVAPCGDPVEHIAGTRVVQEQLCISWKSGGSDAQRWAALRFNPYIFDVLDDEQWQLAQIRRDADSTTLRFGRAFEDLTIEQARARVKTDIERRFPGAKHDAASDALPTALVQRWAAAKGTQTADAFFDDARKHGATWGKGKLLTQWLTDADEVGHLLRGLHLSEKPGRYTFGLARGTGAKNEPRFYFAVYFAGAGGD